MKNTVSEIIWTPAPTLEPHFQVAEELNPRVFFFFSPLSEKEQNSISFASAHAPVFSICPLSFSSYLASNRLPCEKYFTKVTTWQELQVLLVGKMSASWCTYTSVTGEGWGLALPILGIGWLGQCTQNHRQSLKRWLACCHFHGCRRMLHAHCWHQIYDDVRAF